MFTVRKKFRFEAAHRLDNSYTPECQHIHGHSYVVEVFFSTKELDEDGMVIDFGQVSDIVKPILKGWDHRFLMSAGDPNPSGISGSDVLLVSFNPTAEEMARHLFGIISLEVGDLINGKLKVRVHETETGYAEYEED